MPRRSTYDVVVVGSGIGGCTAAALLAKAGRSVLLVEQGDGPGGYAHAFRRGPYTLDPAVHMMADSGPGQFTDVLLKYLGVRDRCTFLPTGSFYGARFPDFSVVAPVGSDFVETQIAAFPKAADDLHRFYALCETVHREAHELPPKLGLRELDAAAAQFPTLFRYQGATAGEVIDQEIADPRARAAVAAFWPYVGLPPSRLCFVTMAQTLVVSVLSCWAMAGGFQGLVDALVHALGLAGGELVLGSRVERIAVENGKVAGVVLDDGTQVGASVVVSNGAARRLLLEQVGEEHLPASFVRRLHRLEPALSAFVMFNSTTADLRDSGLEYETFLFSHWDHEDTYRDVLDGRPGGMWVNVPTLIDPSVAPEGEHLVTLNSLARYDAVSTPEARAEFADQLVAKVEQLVPVLKGSLEPIETATPATLERHTLNEAGATYGWANTPRQTGSKRLPIATPLPGLYLTGHWAQPGSGSIRVLLSGLHAATTVLARDGEGLDGFEAPVPAGATTKC
jgi:phytoene dehydrogenase-like protein